MITIDQNRIAAPDFPRSQEWWTRFLPVWVTGTVQSDGTVTVEPRAEVVRFTPGGGIRWELAPTKAQSANVRRCRELAIMRWLYQLPQLEPAIVEEAGERCQCWRQPARLHDGHCCFAGSPARICHSMPEEMRQSAEQERRAARLEERYRGYAVKFVLDWRDDRNAQHGAAGEPTDENLAVVLRNCARAPRPEEYPHIRRHVAAYRAELEAESAAGCE